MSSLEQRVLFPIGRYFLLGAALIVFLIFLLSAAFVVGNMAVIASPGGAPALEPLHVEPKPITNPIVKANPSNSPIVARQDPTRRLEESYPDANPTRIILAGDGVPKTEQTVATVEGMLSEAMAAGDDARAYVDNAVEYIKAEKQMTAWSDSLRRYHTQRMALLRAREADLNAARYQAQVDRELAAFRFVLSTAVAFGSLLLLCGILILSAVFAIERNTRPDFSQ